MKKLIIILVFIGSFAKSANSQNKNTGTIAAVGAAAVITGLLVANSVESVKEGFEKHMLEWVLNNNQFSKQTEFELKLIKWEATKKEDLNNVSVVAYLYKEKDKEPIVLLNACSRGWMNELGINFAYVKVYKIDKVYWNKILTTYLNMGAGNKDNVFDLKSIPALNENKEIVKSNIEELSAVSSDAIYFRKDKTFGSDERKFSISKLENNKTHIVRDLDDTFILDLNDFDLNIFLKPTHDIIKLKRSFIFDLTTLFFAN